MRHADLPEEIEELSRRVIGCAIEVHRTLGPGMLEGLYEEAMAYELAKAAIPFERQVSIEIAYKDTVLKGQRIDLVAAGQVVLELKSVSVLTELHSAQTLGYVRAFDAPLGLLMNFNAVRLADGLKRILNARWSKFPKKA